MTDRRINLLTAGVWLLALGLWAGLVMLKSWNHDVQNPRQISKDTEEMTQSPAELAYYEMCDQPTDMQCEASFYAAPEHGRKTASREVFDSTALTCAIYTGFLRLAPYGSTLLVRNVENGKVVLVRVTDNMPSIYAVTGRMLDLSKAAACSLGMVRAGVAQVEVWRME